MRFKNFARFLLVVLFLTLGSTPALANTPDQCGSVDPITPGATVVDAVSDVSAAHIDITEVETSLSGESLTVVFHLRDVPDSLTFNRAEFTTGIKEYEWEVSIDADNDRSTGPGGFDYLLTAYHVVLQSEQRADTTAPIEEVVKASVWETYPGGVTSVFVGASLEVSAEADTITLVGIIPGITSESRLAFEADDAHFLGESDQIACHDPYRKFAGPWQCDAGIAVIHPGQTVLDAIEEAAPPHRGSSGDTQVVTVPVFGGALSAYMDITEVSSSLSGERLTVIFHLRDVPETLTFNRTGISENYMEYEWEVAIDVDNDRATGDGGFETLLSAYHIVRLSEGRENMQVPIESKAKASVWKMEPGSTMTVRDASLDVSADEDTITLTGYIPGITAESRLAFRTYEYSGGFDEVGCHAAHSQKAPASQCTADEPTVAPGQTATDDVLDVSAAYLDIVEVNTSLSGEILTVVFHFRDIPETLTFNRTNTSAESTEYMWEVSVDVDANQETGDGGSEYLLSAYHIVPLAHMGDNTEAAIEDVAEASVWERQSEGSIRTLRDASLEVSSETDTMILSGRIPGITPDSRLTFRTHEYLGESDEVGCQALPSVSTSSSQCDTGEAVRPGQSVTDDLSDALAAHVDVTEISTSLSGETLTVVFHLRDVPETLTFDRTGVPGNVTEYSWEVSIDVDADQETGVHGFEYILSAIHVSLPGSSGRDWSTAISTDNLQTNTWDLNPEGTANLDIAFLEYALIEVSAEEDTITLSGEIPGITAESQLAFGVYDYLGGTEEVGCLSPFGLGQPFVQSSYDGPAVTPGQAVFDDVSQELVGHIDIRDVTTTLDGETLTVTFRLRDVPETLTFDRTGVPEHALEYIWEVSIDVDNDPETGTGGFDYMLSASYFVHPLARDSNTVAQITQPGFVEASIWGLDREGNRVLAEAGIELSADENTITLSGEIPGITGESPLKYKAYDYFDGSVEMSSHPPSITGLVSSPCHSDDEAITPGQSVVDATSDALPAHVDITEVSTTLTGGETLVVVFHLRDVPETLEFYRKNVPEDALEYNWEVSIDVDNDRETGLLGADYSLGASHFVLSSSSSGKGVHLHLSEAVQANSWRLDESGGAYLSRVRMEVSPAEDTITFIGDVPGITSQSRLVFEASDFLNGTDQVACQVLSTAGDSE